MDGFPEAFTRFEEVVDVDEIQSFQQLRSAFGSWADRNWRETQKQMMALRVRLKRGGYLCLNLHLDISI